MRTAVPVLVLLLAAGGAAGTGCAGANGERPAAPAPPGVPEVNDAWTSCAAAGAPVAGESPKAPTLLPRLGDDFAPTSIVVCRQIPDKRADGGKELVIEEARATDPVQVAAVADALRLPNGPPLE